MLHFKRILYYLLSHHDLLKNPTKIQIIRLGCCKVNEPLSRGAISHLRTNHENEPY